MTSVSKKIKSLHSVPWLICTLGIIFYSYEFLLRISPSVMVPELRAYFNITAAGFGTLVGLYYMAYTPMQLVVGAIMDLYGPRRILTFAVVICTLGNLIFGTAHSVWFAGVGRFLIGFGSSFAFVGALKLAAIWLPSNRFATFTGIIGGTAMVSAMIGDMTLTRLVQNMGWQETIFFGTIVGAILIPLIWLIVRDNHIGKIEKRITFADIFSGFVEIVHNKQIWLSGFIACLLYLAMSAFGEMWGISFLRNAHHFTPEEAAVANSMIFLGWVIGGPASGWISDKIKKRRLLLLIGSLGAAASMAGVLYVPHISLILCIALLLLFGLFTSVELLCFVVGRESAPRHVAATSMAFVNMFTMAGGFVFQPLIGKLLDLFWDGQIKNGIRIYSSHDYRVALTAIPVAMLLSAVLTLVLRESFGTLKK